MVSPPARPTADACGLPFCHLFMRDYHIALASPQPMCEREPAV